MINLQILNPFYAETAYASTTFVNWPADFSDEIFTVMGSLIDNLNTPLMWIMGVLAVVLVVAVLTRALTHH